MADEPRYRDRAGAIAIADGYLLVIHRVHPVHDEYYVYPGGGIEPGEDPVETVQREVLEETGIKVGVIREVVFGSTPQNHIQHFYLVETTMLPVSLPVHAEENTPERKERRGTYEPMWIPLSKVTDIKLQPSVVTKKLLELVANGFPEHAIDVGSLYPD